MSLSAATRLCGLIGAPVAHSLSPAMHNAAFAHLGLDYVYVGLPVELGAIATAIRGAGALGFVGVNVTVPHKEAALACCEPDALARAVGAVNTITFGPEGAIGTNTDVHGIERAIAALRPSPPRHAVILGAGGAARAIVYALSHAKVPLTIYARRERTLTVDGRAHPVVRLDDHAGLRAHLGAADLIIDATPLGLGDDPCPWPIDAFAPGAAVLDLVVRAETPLIRAARARGLIAQSGGEMLLHQGALAFERFTGRPAPLEVMRHALDAALHRGRHA